MSVWKRRTGGIGGLRFSETFTLGSDYGANWREFLQIRGIILPIGRKDVEHFGIRERGGLMLHAAWDEE